jgi:hypothetical protein
MYFLCVCHIIPTTWQQYHHQQHEYGACSLDASLKTPQLHTAPDVSWITPLEYSPEALQRSLDVPGDLIKSIYQLSCTFTEQPVSASAGALSDVVKSLAPGQQLSVGAWSNAVGKAFLQPYDLNHDSSTFTAASTAGAVHQEALAALPADRVAVYTYQPAANATAGTITR